MHNIKDMLELKVIKLNMVSLLTFNLQILIKSFNKTQILDSLFHFNQMEVTFKAKTFKMI